MTGHEKKNKNLGGSVFICDAFDFLPEITFWWYAHHQKNTPSEGLFLVKLHIKVHLFWEGHKNF